MSRYDQPAGGYSGAFSYPAPPAPPAEPKKRSGLGAAALVLALLALLFGWVPIIGLVMIPPAMLAVLLGVVGFVAALVTGRTGKALPFIASTIGVFALLVPPAATVAFGLAMAPWAYTVGMDQVQIELEYDLKRQGIEAEQAERVSEEIGDALRSFAKPGKWREGIATMHRFEQICEDYRRTLQDLEADDAAGQELAANAFRADLTRLAERQGMNLAEEDLELLTDVLGREQIRRVENWRQYNRRFETQYYYDGEWQEGCGTCPFSCD